MSEKQETLADIIAKVRREYYAGAEYDGAEVQNIIDRIEAAHKREVDALTEKLETAMHCWKVWSDRADELRTKCDEQYAKLKMVSNTTKVREMLETIKWKAISIIPGSSIQKKMLDRFRLLAESALAAPPRNCDRFGMDNVAALLEYEDVCEKSETEESIADAFAWLFLLADNTKGDAK